MQHRWSVVQIAHGRDARGRAGYARSRDAVAAFPGSCRLGARDDRDPRADRRVV